MGRLVNDGAERPGMARYILLFFAPAVLYSATFRCFQAFSSWLSMQGCKPPCLRQGVPNLASMKMATYSELNDALLGATSLLHLFVVDNMMGTVSPSVTAFASHNSTPSKSRRTYSVLDLDHR